MELKRLFKEAEKKSKNKHQTRTKHKTDKQIPNLL